MKIGEMGVVDSISRDMQVNHYMNKTFFEIVCETLVTLS